MTPIASSGVFDITTGTPTKNGGLVLSMKSPSGLFYLDDTYKYIGQVNTYIGQVNRIYLVRSICRGKIIQDVLCRK